MPPSVDELVATSSVVQFIKGPDYAHFAHIFFDTAPTRLLTLSDFLDAPCNRCHSEIAKPQSLGVGCVEFSHACSFAHKLSLA